MATDARQISAARRGAAHGWAPPGAAALARNRLRLTCFDLLYPYCASSLAVQAARHAGTGIHCKQCNANQPFSPPYNVKPSPA